MNILVCFDNSKFSKIALDKAISYNKKFGGSISIIHVLDDDMFLRGTSEVFSNSHLALAKARDMIEDILHHLHDDLKKQKIKSKIALKEGNILDEIISYAKTNKIDLIMIGSLGTGVESNLRLGGIATKLSQSSPCDLLISH